MLSCHPRNIPALGKWKTMGRVSKDKGTIKGFFRRGKLCPPLLQLSSASLSPTCRLRIDDNDNLNRKNYQSPQEKKNVNILEAE